jgi:hypothetical protein
MSLFVLFTMTDATVDRLVEQFLKLVRFRMKKTVGTVIEDFREVVTDYIEESSPADIQLLVEQFENAVRARMKKTLGTFIEDFRTVVGEFLQKTPPKVVDEPRREGWCIFIEGSPNTSCGCHEDICANCRDCCQCCMCGGFDNAGGKDTFPKCPCGQLHANDRQKRGTWMGLWYFDGPFSPKERFADDYWEIEQALKEGNERHDHLAVLVILRQRLKNDGRFEGWYRQVWEENADAPVDHPFEEDFLRMEGKGGT